MARLGRLGAVVILSVGALFLAPAVAFAGCAAHPTAPECLPSPPPGTAGPPVTAQPSAKPSATPGGKPTPAPTQAPSRHTSPPIVHTVNTPEPTFNIEVPKENPLATPQIVVDGPLDNPTNFTVAEPTAGVSSWIFGFIFGFIVGGLVGRASWGLRRRRRQQIFG